MKASLKWLWWDVLSWESPHPFISGVLVGCLINLFAVLILQIFD